MKAVVMVAGRGVRLQPFTLTRPKHMIPVGGVPLLDWTLKRLREAGIDEVLLVTHHMREQIQEFFGDGSDRGMKIEYVDQGRIGGTADAFRVAEPYVDGEAFLGMNGDLFLSPGTIEALLAAHGEGETTLAVLPVDNPADYGVVELDGDTVVRIVEKPKPETEPSRLTNAGVYVFEPEIFRWIGKTKLSPRGEYEITESLRLMIEDGNALVKAVTWPSDSWIDIGLPWHLLDANERALMSVEPTVEGEVERGAVLQGKVLVKRGGRVRSGAYIEGPVVIGEDSDVGPNCHVRPHTSIGAGVRIGNACEVKNSIVMDGTHIAHLSYVGDSIVGEGCNLGAGTITANIRFDKKPIRVNIEGRRVDSERRKLGAFIGDNVQTGVNVSLMPGVKVGPNAWIAPGLTVYDDVPADVFLTPTRAETIAKKKGVAPAPDLSDPMP
jgi:bifunctional UDP-N-acetylglucosamine pyrophosphorylase/glucosamine-1-phosphate N-acetyltransferase